MKRDFVKRDLVKRDYGGRERNGVAPHPIQVGEALVADTVLGPVPAQWDVDHAVTVLYSTHYRSLVRLAALLVADVAIAEEVVRDSFVAMHGSWRRVRDSHQALSYLRKSVVNRSRSARHRVAVDPNAPNPAPDPPGTEQSAGTLLDSSAVVSALHELPARQREALVLRYYADLAEPETAWAMGISQSAVKSYAARGMAALRSVLEQDR